MPPPFVGPYKLSSHHEGKTVTIDREPSWAGNVAAGVPEDPAENNIEGIDITIGINNDFQLLKIKGNQLDLTLNGGIVTGSDVPAIARDPQYADRFFSTFAASVSFIAIHADQPPFDDVRLRQAVNLALDRSRMIKLMAGGVIATSPWSQILPPNLLGGEPSDVYPVTPDVDSAKRLIASTGLATPIKITLVSSAPLTPEKLAVQDALEAVGFEVALKLLPGGCLLPLPQRPNVPLGAVVRGRRDYPDAITFFNALLTCPHGTPAAGNDGRFCDAEFDSAVAAINRLPLGPERVARFAELSTEMMRDSAPLLPYASARHVALVSDRIGNYRFGPTKGEYLTALFLRTP